MLRTLTLTLALLLPCLAAADVSSMPPPPEGTWVVDETQTLSDTQRVQLNVLAQSLHDEASGQLAIVIVDRAGGDPRRVALALFNHWGVGSEEFNDGALLFVALSDRAVETILGDGVDGSAEQAESDTLMRSRIVPAFKAGRPQDAIVTGAQGLADLLRGAAMRRQQSALEQQRQAQLSQALAAFEAPSTSRVVDPQSLLGPDDGVLIESLRPDVPEFLLVVHPPIDGFTSEQVAHFLFQRWGAPPSGWLVTLSQDGKDAGVVVPWGLRKSHPEASRYWRVAARALTQAPSQRSAAIESAMKYVVALDTEERGRQAHEARVEFALGLTRPPHLFGTLGLGAVALWGARQWLRRRPRTCKVCRQKRQRLDEGADDAHLDEGQRQEERLDSVDYDVWYCETCDDALVIPWQRLSSHRPCKQCKYRTVTESCLTLVHATYDHGGKVQITLECAHCSHVETYTRSTPQKTQSTSSGSSSSSSSSSSFGGGSSSGGGSSGRW
jgi:uncharacterized membrane protein YgcG